MTIHLDVALYGTPLGTISGKDWRSADVTFTPEALSQWGVGSCVLSAAAPLQVTPRKAHAERRRNVFAELLPEGVTRERLARTAGVPTNDVVGLLTHYGRDVAGALAVADPRTDGEPPTPQLVTLPEATLHELVSAPLEARLGNHPSLGRTSLAGVQGKLALTRSHSGEWLRPTGGAASTHIVKPPVDGNTAALAEEILGHRLSTACGLATHDVWLEQLAGVECLVIERYDRTTSPTGDVVRAHQEDMNQALGVSGDAKYQEIGGAASLRRVADVFNRLCGPNALVHLARHVVAAVAMGNLDMHAKNISLLHHEDGSHTPAPAYDMVPHAHTVGADGRLALAIGGEYVHARVRRGQLVREVQSWGVTDAPAVVDGAIAVVAEAFSCVDVPSGAEQAATYTDSILRQLAGS